MVLTSAADLGSGLMCNVFSSVSTKNTYGLYVETKIHMKIPPWYVVGAKENWFLCLG